MVIQPHMVVPSQRTLANYYGEQRSQQIEDVHSHEEPPPMDYLPLPPGMTPSSYLSDRSSTSELLSAQYAQAQESMRHDYALAMKLEGRDATEHYLADDENTLPAPNTSWARSVPTSQRRHPLLPPGQTYHPLINPEPEASGSVPSKERSRARSPSRHRRHRSATESPCGSPRRLTPMRKMAEKKPTLACLFCRGRKIACGPPIPGSKDKTCK